jgi:hypothetical protein
VIEGLALVLVLATGAAEEAKFSCEEAIIPSPGSGMTVVQSEYQWLRNTFGGGSLVRQALGASSDGKRRYDLILWRKPNGQAVEVCFDVTTVFEETIRRIEDGDPDRPAR